MSALTPSTSVMSGFFAGAVMTTFFAPAARCFAALSRSVKSPVDSNTTSTPRSFHGSCAGSFTDRTWNSSPSTVIRSPFAEMSPFRLPRIESYLSRCASVAALVRSLTATKSRSFDPSAARMMLRPMRPNPLMPTLMAILSSSLLAGPHPRSLSRVDGAPRSGRRRFARSVRGSGSRGKGQLRDALRLASRPRPNQKIDSSEWLAPRSNRS